MKGWPITDKAKPNLIAAEFMEGYACSANMPWKKNMTGNRKKNTKSLLQAGLKNSLQFIYQYFVF